MSVSDGPELQIAPPSALVPAPPGPPGVPISPSAPGAPRAPAWPTCDVVEELHRCELDVRAVIPEPASLSWRPWLRA